MERKNVKRWAKIIIKTALEFIKENNNGGLQNESFHHKTIRINKKKIRFLRSSETRRQQRNQKKPVIYKEADIHSIPDDRGKVGKLGSKEHLNLKV